MYKVLLFLKYTTDEAVKEQFRNKLFGGFSVLKGPEAAIARLDGSLLSEEGFVYLIDISFSSAEDSARFFQTPGGKELNKLMTDFRNYISIFMADYEAEK